MKTKVNYLILVALFPLFLNSQPYFTRLTPFPQENTLNSITKVPGTNRIIAVGQRSTVLISDYYGNFWDVNYNPGGLDNEAIFSYIYFVDSLTGFISANRGILKTIDGGNSWYEVYTNGLQLSYKDLAFINQTTGFAVGVYTNILKTTDGGETWDIVESGATFWLNQIEFFDESTGIITGYSTEKILRTTDGGESWDLVDYPQGLPNDFVLDINSINNVKGFAFVFSSSSYSGYLLRTQNTGLTWDTVYSDYGLYSGHIDFSNEMQGAMVPTSFYSNLVITTNDGGETWTEQPVPGIEGVSDNYICYNGNFLYITGLSGKMYRSSDNGGAWERIDKRTFNDNIYQMQFLNDNTGFALSTDYGSGVASSGLFKTDNGGETWERIANLMNSNGAFCFINLSAGMYCYEGIGTTIAKTEDGGETWTFIDFTDISLNPYVIKFFDDNNGLIAGEGPILRTTDGGETWQEVDWNTGNYDGICDICYKSENEVYSTGEPSGSGTFVGKSLDGGLTWQLTGLGNYSGGENIVFTNENTAFIACGNSTILKSTDSGNSWNETEVNTTGYINFKSVTFTSENTGYAVGDGNYENFFMTTDGGDTWDPVNSGTSASFSSMHFFDENNGLVGGSKGVLYKVSNEITQFNPPQNLDGSGWYVCPLNFYHISWDAPDTTNAPELVAYKVFRFGYLLDSIPVTGFYGYDIIDTVTGTEPGYTGGQVCYFVSAVYDNPPGESTPTDELCLLYLTKVNSNIFPENDIQINPNPAINEIAIEINAHPEEKAVMTIFDINGKALMKKEIEPDKNRIDISGLEEGLYFVNVKTNSGSMTKKIIKAERK